MIEDLELKPVEAFFALISGVVFSCFIASAFDEPGAEWFVEPLVV